MTTAPNQKKLIITHKENKAAHPTYKTDMRTIEQWANAQPIGVEQIIAGTNITISPTDGEGVVTINATSGGGSAPAQAVLTAGPDTVTYNTGEEIVLGPSSVTGPEFRSFWDLFDNTGVGSVTYTIATSWFVVASAGQSICFLPEITPPSWSAGGVSALLQMNCSTLDFVNTAQYQQSSPGTLTSGTPFQPTAADYSAISTASDITLTAGPGFTGNGLVTGGLGSPYLASVQLDLVVAAGTTFV